MRRVIGITMGDPAGVGPEIVVKALMQQMVYDKCKPIVIGDAKEIILTSGVLGKKKITAPTPIL